MIPLGAWLLVALALAVLGAACVVARRSLARAWMGIALILQAATLVFAASAQADADPRTGRALAVFTLFLMAAQAAAAIALAGAELRRARRGPRG